MAKEIDSLQINVAQLLKEGVGAQRSYKLEADGKELGDVNASAPVRSTLKLTRINGGILAQVDANTEVAATCCRCLADAVIPVRVRFTEEFVQLVDLESGAHLHLSEDDDRFKLDENHTLDLAEALRQYALTALPISPVCKEDCKGLCEHCGADQNLTQCNHNEQTVDPRLAGLAQLLTDEGSQE